jgi:uncharacterized protein YycO
MSAPVTAPARPQPGDFAVVSTAGPAGKLIGLGEKLCGDAFTQYQHAFVYIGGMVVEAEAAGARTRKMTRFDSPGQLILWSAGRIPLTGPQRDAICLAARGYIGTPYSWLDYLAIAAHRFHIPAPGLRGFIESQKSMICSQLVDAAYQAAGVQLFDDGRWNGYVTPADLAAVIENAVPASAPGQPQPPSPGGPRM